MKIAGTYFQSAIIINLKKDIRTIMTIQIEGEFYFPKAFRVARVWGGEKTEDNKIVQTSHLEAIPELPRKAIVWTGEHKYVLDTRKWTKNTVEGVVVSARKLTKRDIADMVEACLE